MSIVTMHQPNYLPWIGLFSKVAQTECFIIMDTFQYTRHGVIHRNKIRTNNGSSYLTIPIGKEFAVAKIKDVTLPQDNTWREIHWQSIYHNYVKTDFFKYHADFFEKLYKQDFAYLWQINLEIIRYMLKSFDINVTILKASDLNIDMSLKHTDMIIAVLKSIGASTYLSGQSGRDYVEVEEFSQNNLTCKFAKFTHPIYQQRYPGFEPNLSAIDLLFNVGLRSSQVIRESGGMED
jgi:hypothetical protein